MGETLLTRRCEFSECRSYRYTLWREWAIEDLFAECSADTQAHTYLLVIGLNPSTADETKDDPTIRREIDFAKRWGLMQGQPLCVARHQTGQDEEGHRPDRAGKRPLDQALRRWGWHDSGGLGHQRIVQRARQGSS
jgi:hypothetical protein